MLPNCFVSRFATGSIIMYSSQEGKHYLYCMYSRSVLTTAEHVLCMEKSIQQLNRKATYVEQYYNLSRQNTEWKPLKTLATNEKTACGWRNHIGFKILLFGRIRCTQCISEQNSRPGMNLYRLKSRTEKSRGKEKSFEINFNTRSPRRQSEMATLLVPLLACVQVKALPILIEGEVGGHWPLSAY